MNIDIFTCLTENSLPYANFLYKNLISTYDNSDNLRFHAIADDKFIKSSKYWKIENIVNNSYTNASANHASMLNIIINYIPDDSDILIITDCDVAILQKNWNTTMKNLLNTYDVLIAPKFSGASAVFLLTFKTDIYKKVNPNFMPGTKQNGYKVTTAMLDTGYLLDEEFSLYNKFYYKYVENYQSNESFFSYGYLLNEKLFLTHLSGSHKKPFQGSLSQNWIKNIKNYLKQ